MRGFVAGVLLGLGLAGSAHAGEFDDPKALLTSLFAPYTHGQKPADLEQYYTDWLKAEFAQHMQKAEIGGVGMPPDPKLAQQADFDPFVSDKHYLLMDLAIGDPVIQGDRALVMVSYKNFDQPRELSVSLRQGPDGWKVDDVASMGPGPHWLLSWLLTYDPLGTL